MSSLKPCVEYKSKFDVTKMEQAKLELNARSKKVPIFSAKHGVEGLFHVIDQFQKAARRLAFQPADLWDQFEDVLDTTAANKWNNQIQGIAGGGARSRNRFLREQLLLVHSCAGEEHPRDVMFKYIDQENGECHKPLKADCQEHAARVETLCRMANRLQGTLPVKDDQNIKLSVHNTLPKQWRNDYRKSQRDFNNDTIQQIIGYMNLCKAEADDDMAKAGKSKKHKAEDSSERIRGGGTSKSSKTTTKKKTTSATKKQVSDSDTCPVHGGHKWGACSLNPRSTNWRGSNNCGNHYGGRGFGGRSGRGGFGGRGRGNGGRDGGRGRGHKAYHGYHEDPHPREDRYWQCDHDREAYSYRRDERRESDPDTRYGGPRRTGSVRW